MIRKEPVPGNSVAIVFSLPADHPAMPVSVVGSFNDWQPLRNPLKVRPDGSATAMIVVPVGTLIHFRYLGANGHWFDDIDAQEATEDGGFLVV
ncbi:isoamylase [uncultured Propionibacterium sp.]|uniref:isoamylase n=1 Tax=uncultured Propionibacterium sp. TaxID=218066 RepID=UPI0029300FDB|nr:isoamylase [uncultured Propionibacterium sp.]